MEEAGLEPAYSALSVLGNPLPAASYKPTQDSSSRVASQCIRNLRRFLTCAAAITLTESKFCGALPFALLPHVKLVTPPIMVFLQGLEPRLISVLSTVPLPIGLKKHGASGRSRTYRFSGLNRTSLPFLYKRMKSGEACFAPTVFWYAERDSNPQAPRSKRGKSTFPNIGA